MYYIYNILDICRRHISRNYMFIYYIYNIYMFIWYMMYIYYMFLYNIDIIYNIEIYASGGRKYHTRRKIQGAGSLSANPKPYTPHPTPYTLHPKKKGRGGFSISIEFWDICYIYIIYRIYVCMYIIYIEYTYVYAYTCIEREKERERERICIYVCI